jgi:NodT family efflux transporter outer membrane factor (OMF) lipoprotein
MRCNRILPGAAAAALFAAAGCAVGPDYHRPAPAAAPAAWQATPGGGETDRPIETAEWWKEFGDPTLNSLVGRALASNLDLRAVEARLRQARAVRELSAAALRPTLDASGSYAKEKISRNQPLFGALPLPPNFPYEYSVYQAGFDASWEIDIFGAKRRALEAATADWESASEARNDAVVSLEAEVARDYIELRGSQRRLEIARGNAASQQQALKLTRARFEAGLTSEIDPTRAASLLAGLQATVPAEEAAVAQAMYGLAALLGSEPGALVAELSTPSPIPPVPPEVPVGLPADLLRRRPDVRRAERQLAAATARIGQAKADWFPRLSLNGDAGMESVSVGKWFEPGSLFWSLGPTLQWRALDFGRVRAEVAAQTAAQEGALADYQKAVVAALRDAEDALVAYARQENSREALARELAEDRRSVAMADSLYADGQVNFLSVLDARRSLYQAEDQVAASDQAVSLDLVALFKALGGGWEK